MTGFGVDSLVVGLRPKVVTKVSSRCMSKSPSPIRRNGQDVVSRLGFMYVLRGYLLRERGVLTRQGKHRFKAISNLSFPRRREPIGTHGLPTGSNG